MCVRRTGLTWLFRCDCNGWKKWHIKWLWESEVEIVAIDWIKSTNVEYSAITATTNTTNPNLYMKHDRASCTRMQLISVVTYGKSMRIAVEQWNAPRHTPELEWTLCVRFVWFAQTGASSLLPMLVCNCNPLQPIKLYRHFVDYCLGGVCVCVCQHF